VAASTIQPYDESHREGVLDVLAEAYAATPISLALVGGTGEQQLRQVRILFALRLPTMSGEKLVAVHDGSVVGFAHWVRHPLYDALPEHPPSGTQSLLTALPESVLRRLAVLVREWGRHDLDSPHSHLGPIAVAPSFQGIGIGRRFMRYSCLDIDACNAVAYLETDRSENVRFFSEFGFNVTSEIEILGVKNWFMTRRVR
jgi:ribosomal protein S18 acetylase RimI-like enzyme